MDEPPDWAGRRPRRLTASLRAKRSNPVYLRGGSLDCFVARAPRNDKGERLTPSPPRTTPR
ncbi:hypothetical protein FXB38_21595 [Bradyrhizobium cytisi]|uniref:Uncharacterized protein n=1 Tax=Bradyrhizobium cytisi TaxID=515489 RepID=A0A5S4WJL1_9BRAD|nr:hypothetical protein FXB38_21595 [Bradyrhizobium cytisi]